MERNRNYLEIVCLMNINKKLVIKSQILFIKNFHIKKIFIHIFIRNCIFSKIFIHKYFLIILRVFIYVFITSIYLFKQNVVI